jgi:hypothetical protein
VPPAPATPPPQAGGAPLLLLPLLLWLRWRGCNRRQVCKGWRRGWPGGCEVAHHHHHHLLLFLILPLLPHLLL